MACGLLFAGIVALILSASSSPRAAHVVTDMSGRSAAGIDYISFAIGLASGLALAEIARLSWSDMPRRLIGWLVAKRHGMKYFAYGCVWLTVLIYI